MLASTPTMYRRGRSPQVFGGGVRAETYKIVGRRLMSAGIRTHEITSGVQVEGGEGTGLEESGNGGLSVLGCWSLLGHSLCHEKVFRTEGTIPERVGQERAEHTAVGERREPWAIRLWLRV